MNGITQRLFTQAHDPDRLPVPTLPRYTLLRVGIQNVWEYDTSTRFVTRDGRLLLRGQNESGKTKAIELSLPAVVDAILRAERLDPFGERARPMRENLIGPHTSDDTTVVIGYVWAEFGRLDQHDQPRYHTAGYGVRASRNAAGFTSWCFLTELRPDVDFDLFPGNQPRTQRDLEGVLGGRGQVFEMPKQLGTYRSAVNRTLFGFEEMGQFDNLMRLLIELRRPQLAKHLRPNDLSEVLSASLPPLDVNLVTKVAEGVDRLQEHREAVEGLRETLRTIARFNGTYRRYLQAVVAERAASVRSAASRVDDAARLARDAAAKLEQAKQDKEAAEAERAELATTRSKLQTRADTLKNSDRFHAVADLADARRLAAEVDQTIARVNRRLKGEKNELARASKNLEQQRRKHAGCEAKVADAHADAAGTARLPGLETDQRQATALVDQEDLDGASAVIAAAITQVRDRIAELAPHDTALAKARSEIDGAQERLDARAEQASEARSAANQAAAAVGTVTQAFRQQVMTWAGSLEELVLDPDFGEQAAMVQADRIRDLVDDAARGHQGELVDELGRLGAELQQATRHRDDLTADRDALLAEEYAPPKLAPWRQLAPTRPGAPLYLLGAFRETVPSDQQAAVEAALEAAQLLDAWVHPDGTIDRPEHDLGLRVDPIANPERSLLQIIEPVRPAASTSAPRRRCWPASASATAIVTPGLTWMAASGSAGSRAGTPSRPPSTWATACASVTGSGVWPSLPDRL